MSLDKIDRQLQHSEQQRNKQQIEYEKTGSFLQTEMVKLKEKREKVVRHPLYLRNQQHQQKIEELDRQIAGLRSEITRLLNEKDRVQRSIKSNNYQICEDTGGHLLQGYYCSACDYDNDVKYS